MMCDVAMSYWYQYDILYIMKFGGCAALEIFHKRHCQITTFKLSQTKRNKKIIKKFNHCVCGCAKRHYDVLMISFWGYFSVFTRKFHYIFKKSKHLQNKILHFDVFVSKQQFMPWYYHWNLWKILVRFLSSVEIV